MILDEKTPILIDDYRNVEPVGNNIELQKKNVAAISVLCHSSI